MRNFDHKNVLSIVGFAVKNGNPCILLPYMEHKDLRTYITQHEQVTYIDMMQYYN
jgi:hypothetical protein